jgi:16S rRNA (adenine1518-N6/adenine1519-N6)-dimethyltransferase
MKREEIEEIFNRYNLKPKKIFGQNFLIDEEVADELLKTDFDIENRQVLEVGPGLGVLTKRLAEEARKVIAVEIDDRLAQIIRRRLTSSNLEVINQDILQFDLSSLKPGYLIISSLPYSISSPFVKKIILDSNKPKFMNLLLQKEVASRLAAPPGSSERGILSVVCQLFYDIKVVKTVNSKSFYPAPKVDSAVISFKLKDEIIQVDDINKFMDLVACGFRHRRKKLINSLTGSNIDISKTDLESAFKKSKIDFSSRAQNLTNNQWLELYQLFFLKN